MCNDTTATEICWVEDNWEEGTEGIGIDGDWLREEES